MFQEMAYDPDVELADCLARPVTEGARAEPLHPLTEMARMIGAHPRCTVAISDVHGWPARLWDALGALGLIDGHGRRIAAPQTTIIQIGDGVDGRRALGDLEALAMLLRVCDRYLVGNHEAAYLGGPGFRGQPMSFDLKLALEQAARQGRLSAAHAEADVLFTHAGVDPRLCGRKRAASAAAFLERLWEGWLGSRGRSARPIFASEPRRGGWSPYGGILWQEWRSLLAAPATAYRQVVGHSPLGRVESDQQRRRFCFDLGGSRLGVCVCWPDGRLLFGSDVIPGDQAAPPLGGR